MSYQKNIKRPMDFILSLVVIVTLIPVLIIVSILIRMKLGSPVLFKQKRPGFNGEIFTMYKFRTMTDEKADNGELLSDSVRLTKFGKMLRATSLDELPELFNILKGDMSIVGPRPQLIRDIVFMSSEQRKRHTVLPGLTGWAQVNGRNEVTWEEKLSLDLDYIIDITFVKDLKIIFISFIKVFQREGVNAEGMDTSEDFGDYLLRKKKITEQEYFTAMEESKQLMIQ